MAQHAPRSQRAALTLLLSTGVANFMFWLVWGPQGPTWGPKGLAGMLWALAVTAAVGLIAFVFIRPERWLFGPIAAAALVLLYVNLVDAHAGGSNEYLGVMLAALLLPIILILAVAAFVRSFRRDRISARQAY